ncbi:MAG TPA: phosphoenolpyruvate-utilizing N-terminal domain-containing protein, partial [Anaerolineae bacterium]|nr:phosphoenolpyruvate-utilizing N-terminal domain-containing protein [Anaerolineae bacterium]
MSVQTLHGISASPGIAIGPVYLYAVQHVVVARRSGFDVDNELDRLASALTAARQQLAALTERARQAAGADEAAVFEAHQMFLDDPELLDRVRTLLRKESVSAEYAWQAGTHHYAETLSRIDDEYLAARAADVKDVAQRVLRILVGVHSEVGGPQTPAVIAAEDLTPSDTVTLDKSKVLAFCTAGGGPTSHVAILSKALGIPAVVGLSDSFSALKNARTVIVDGG